MAETANSVYRDFVADGVPSSGKHDPHKPDIRRLLTSYEQIISTFTSNGGLIYSSLALLNADLVHNANTMAWVLGDATAANNGVYGKVGASGSGSWTRRSDLPFSFIIASDAGAGTPNAIQATTSIPVSSSSLVMMNVFEANTASPVTVAFNGGSILTVKSNTGNDVSAGGLVGGMQLLGVISGSTFRLLNDQVSSAIVAAAEAAAAAAVTAKNAAEAAAAGVSLPSVTANTMLVDNAAGTLRQTRSFSQVRALLGDFDTNADFLAASISAVLNRVKIGGFSAYGDYGAHELKRISTPSPVELWHKQSFDGAWWEIVPGDALRPEMMGATPLIVYDAATKAWYDACSTKPSYFHFRHMDLIIRLLKLAGIWAKAKYVGMFGGAAVGDCARNVKSPGTLDGTVHGNGTFTSGVGPKGNDVDSYISISGWNNLIAQDAAFLAVSYLPGATETGNLVSSVLGTSSGVAVNPRSSGGNLSIRLNSSSAYSVSRSSRYGNLIVSRGSSSTFLVYEEGEKTYTATNTSSAVTTDTATLNRSGTDYGTDTLRMFICGDQALTDDEADALDWIMSLAVERLPGVVGKGPSCASIGFTSGQTPTQRSTIMAACAKYAQRFDVPIQLSPGNWHLASRLPATRRVRIIGDDRRGSVISFSSDPSVDEPLFAPTHYNGGEDGWELTNVTLDMQVETRGITGIGTQRPGGSAVSSNGSKGFVVRSIDIINPVLHGVDYCNTGEVVSSDREYSNTPNATKWNVGVRSSDGIVEDVVSYFSGDDHVTTHYSDGGNGRIEWVWAYMSSGRHPTGGALVSIGVESDDGSKGFRIAHVYARGLARAVAVKNHAGDPAPINCRVRDVTAERCGQGVAFYDDNNSGTEGNNTLDGLTFSRPVKRFVSHEVYGFLARGNADIKAANLTIKARGDETDLRGAIHIGGAKRVKVSAFDIVNWKAADTATDMGTIRVTSTCEDISISRGTASGAGLYGLHDSGSVRADYDDITVKGTGVASSKGFYVTGGSGHTSRSTKVGDTYSAGVSGFVTATDIT